MLNPQGWKEKHLEEAEELGNSRPAKATYVLLNREAKNRCMQESRIVRQRPFWRIAHILPKDTLLKVPAF